MSTGGSENLGVAWPTRLCMAIDHALDGAGRAANGLPHPELSALRAEVLAALGEAEAGKVSDLLTTLRSIADECEAVPFNAAAALKSIGARSRAALRRVG
jgi:hypothetical protein